MMPVPILQWFADHLNCNGTGVFKKGKGIIHLRREMVIQIFGIQSGAVPFPMDITYIVIINRVLQLQAEYLTLGQQNVAVDNIVNRMKNDETEEGFIRSFMFLFISTVFCSTTQNYANWKLLYGLHDITQLKTFDLPQLCIDHLNKEIDNFSTKLFNRTKIPLNNTIYVGGCLSLAVIVYLDFVDFSKASKQANINYGVPRMAHIKNEDFDYLTSVDSKTTSKKPFALGFLPMKYISRTPYSACAIILAEEKWSKAPRTFHSQEHETFPQTDNVASTTNNNSEVLNMISQIVAKHEKWKRIHEQLVQNMYAEMKTIVMSLQHNSNSQVNNAGTSTKNPIILLSGLRDRDTNNVIKVQSPTQVDETLEAHSAGNKGTISEPVQRNNSKQDQEVDANNTPTVPFLEQVDSIHTANKTNPNQLDSHQVNTPTMIVQETPVSVLNETPNKEMSACCSSVPILFQSNPGLEIILSPLNNSSFCIPNDFNSETIEDLRDGVKFSLKFVEDSLIAQVDKLGPKDHVFPKNKESDAALHISGPSTIHKRNKKKRKAKMLCSQEKLLRITSEPHVQEFYKKYLANKYYKNGNNPIVINVNGFPVEYDSFYNSLKAVGNVDNQVFNAYVQVFNYDNECPDPKAKQPSKYCFTSYFTEKMLVDPKNFNCRSCLRELKKTNSGKNIHKRDRLYFPRVDSFHWTLFCVNNLFETVNFFDSRSSVPQNQVNKLTSNLINLGTLFKSVGWTYKNVENFECISPENYPKQNNLHNCALYAIMYMDNWDGKNMKDFDDENIPPFRQVVAYKLAKSDLNEE